MAFDAPPDPVLLQFVQGIGPRDRAQGLLQTFFAPALQEIRQQNRGHIGDEPIDQGSTGGSVQFVFYRCLHLEKIGDVGQVSEAVGAFEQVVIAHESQFPPADRA